MTAREAIALFRSKASKSGFISDDDAFPPRRILWELKTIIAVIKRRRVTQKKRLANHDIVTLDCVELTTVDQIECPTIPPSGLQWAKSVAPLPRYIKLIDITTILGNEAITLVDWTKVRARQASRNLAIQRKPIATVKSVGDKLYLYILNTGLESVAVTMVPEDYYEAVSFPRCGELNQRIVCNPLDVEVGADLPTIAEASDIVLATEFKSAQGKPDQENNDNSIS